jgi:flagellar motor switch protein FliG
MTGAERAAILLNSLPAEAITPVLVHLGPERLIKVRAEMARFEKAPPNPEQLDQLARDFELLLLESAAREGKQPEDERSPRRPGDNSWTGGPVSAPDPGKATTTPAKGGSESDHPLPEEIDADPIAALGRFDSNRLAQLLAHEHPRTVTLILHYLDAQHGGEVLKGLPAALRREVSLRLGSCKGAGPEILRQVVQALASRGQSPPGTSTPGEASNYRKIADIFRTLDKPERLDVLAALEENDAAAAAAVKEFLYQFEDLRLLDDRSMQKLLAEVDSKTLGTALKGAPQNITDRVLANLSKRAKESLKEEMELLGSVPGPQLEQARKSLVEIFQRMDQAGELTMNG